MARSLLVPYPTGTSPYPEVPPRPMARPMVPWTPYPIRVLDPGPRLDRAEFSEGPSGSAQGSKGQIPDGSQHGTWPPLDPMGPMGPTQALPLLSLFQRTSPKPTDFSRRRIANAFVP